MESPENFAIGFKTLESNIRACLAVAEVIKSTLGPSGNDKLIHFKNPELAKKYKNEVFVSNDGAAILSRLNIRNPACNLFVELAKGQDNSVGDGTTTTVLLAAGLLQRALDWITSGVPSIWMIKGYRKASSIAISIIEEISIPLKKDNQDTLLQHVVRTCIGSKVINRFPELFAQICVGAVMRLDGSNNLQHIHISKKTGPSMSNSCLIDGIILDTRVGLGCPSRIENAKILVTRMDLEVWRTKIWGTQIRVHSHEEGANFTMNERQKIREKCKAIIDLGVNVLINHGQIYSVAEQYFAENGVVCVQISDFLECEIISLATGSPILSDVQGVLPSQLGNAKCVEEIVMGDSKVVKISGCPNPKACTILLRAPTLSLLDECERSVHDALCVVNAAIKSKKLIGGGGCVQIEIAKRIREASIYEVGKEQLAMQAFAETLESLPLILAQNGGYDGTAILAACRQKHQSPEGLWFGVDVKRGKPADMVNEAHVLEPSDVLVSAIQSATEAAEMILRIDQNVNLKEENKETM